MPHPTARCRLAASLWLGAALWMGPGVSPSAAQADPPAAGANEPVDVATGAPLADPFFLLIQAPAVRDELGLSARQARSIDRVLARQNRLLLAIRDVGPQGAPESAQPALEETRQAVGQLLTPAQRQRLDGLILQAQGYAALEGPSMIASLQLSHRQVERLRDINARFRKQRQPQPSAESTDRRPGTARPAAQQQRQQQVLEVLDDEQQRAWSAQLGEPFDFEQVQRSPAAAPPFTGATEWINSPPLDLESLRGKVVVVHFFAFGCINCVRNYPWYREWHRELADREFQLVGIHTPEIQREADVEQLRAALDQQRLRFPVAVDNERALWQAWSNSIWPSVYVIDKRGRVRDWWYGELDWQDAGGQVLTRRLIDRLLQEEAPATSE